MFLRILFATACLLGMLATTTQAQLTRESGASSVAGTLQKGVDEFDDYEFDSRGNQVLFVDLDADIYINREPHDSHDAEGTPDSTHDGGCTTHDDGGEEEGCAGGGNGRFILEVLAFDQTRICMAAKPARPGWDTDPRLACLLSDPGAYLLRVTLAGMGGHEEEEVTGPGEVHPYLLNVSLRDLVDDLPGLQLDKAVKESVNRLPFNKGP